jgi:glycosyl transferase family 2
MNGFSPPRAGSSIALMGRGPRIAVDPHRLFLRVVEIIPGALTWATLLGLGLLAFVVPAWIAVFIILYDLYWLIRAVYIAVHLLASYRLLRFHRGIDWQRRLRLIGNFSAARTENTQRLRELAAEHASIPRWHLRERRRLGIRLWQERAFRDNLQTLGELRGGILAPDRVRHVVILPTYKEPLSVLRTTLECLRATDIPKDRLWVVVALEERAGAHTESLVRQIREQYDTAFGKLLLTIHPDGLPGEQPVKSANATWAAREVRRLLEADGIPCDDVVVSNFDSDTCVSPEYFSYLTYVYCTTPDRTRCSYQPLPLYHNNIWDAPAFTRVIATNSSFWQMIEAVRPERLVTFSSHSMSMRALVDVGFWQTDIVSEDSRIYWQCFLKYDGRYRVIPLFTTVSMDATRARTLWRTFINQYKQKRRWAWGIENFPYLAHGFLHRRDIPLRRRLWVLFVLLEGNHSWATSAIIIAFLGWLPVLFGGAAFHQTILAYNLPFVTRTLMTAAMSGLIVTMALTLLLLPPAPPGTPKRKYVYMVLQWALVPIIASVLGSVPAIDAQTRLMLGRPLGFWVTEKARTPTRARSLGV